MEDFLNALGDLVDDSELSTAEVVYGLEAFKLALLTGDDDEEEGEGEED